MVEAHTGLVVVGVGGGWWWNDGGIGGGICVEGGQFGRECGGYGGC